MSFKHPALALSLTAVAFLAGRATSAPQEQDGGEAEPAGMSAPGKEHRLLDRYEGTWDASLKMPAMGDMEMTGEITNSWILGGHYMKQEFTAPMMGFQGMGLVGYSNIDGKYQGFWIDNMSGHMLFSNTGEFSEDGRTFVSTAEEPDQMTGGMKKVKDVVVFEDPDKHVFTKYVIDDAGNETVDMEITYTRQ